MQLLPRASFMCWAKELWALLVEANNECDTERIIVCLQLLDMSSVTSVTVNVMYNYERWLLINLFVNIFKIRTAKHTFLILLQYFNWKTFDLVNQVYV